MRKARVSRCARVHVCTSGTSSGCSCLRPRAERDSLPSVQNAHGGATQRRGASRRLLTVTTDSHGSPLRILHLLDTLAALAALAVLLGLVLALWLSLFLLLSLLLPCLACLRLSLRTRFPFHDSQALSPTPPILFGLVSMYRTGRHRPRRRVDAHLPLPLQVHFQVHACSPCAAR